MSYGLQKVYLPTYLVTMTFIPKKENEGLREL